MSNSTQPPQATIDQIIGLYNQGQLEQTVSLGESLATQYPNAIILYDLLGAAYMGLGNADGTIESYQKALQFNPNHTDAYNNMGMALYDQGRFDEAVESYQKAIKLEPDFADAHYNLGNALKETGDLKQAVESYQTSIVINPSDAEVLLNYGNALKNYGDFDQAAKIYAQALKIDPNYAAAQTNMDDATDEKAEIDKLVADYARVAKLEIGSAKVANFTGTRLKTRGYLDAAIDSYKQATKIKPDYADPYYNMGDALKKKGELDAAIDSYKQALKIKPDHADACLNIGIALQDKGDLDAAIDSYKQALKIKPDHAEAYNNIGNALSEKGEVDAAIDSYKQALKIKPDHAEAYNNMGNALRDKGEVDAAIDSCKQALKIKPDHAEAYNNMGNALRDKGKVDAAIDSYQQAIKIKPDYAEAYSNMGTALRDKGCLDEAIKTFEIAVNIQPSYTAGYNNLGIVLTDRGKVEEAIETYNQALKINPHDEAIRVRKLHQQAHICDWSAIEEDRDLVRTLGTVTQHVSPFALLALEDAPERHRKRSEIYAANKFKKTQVPLSPCPNQQPKRLRVGYFSSDFNDHPVSYLIGKMLSLHDGEQFEIYAYSFGKDGGDEIRKKIINSVNVFHDVRNMSDMEIALLARQDKIDIAVDLNGHTNNARMGIFKYRAAPIQINYLGIATTTGAHFIDYIIADRIVIPQKYEKYYTEKIIHLPNCYQVNDNTTEISNRNMTRLEMGLPEKGFVFACFNQSYKIQPTEFDVWMRILHKVEGSVLWLYESNYLMAVNLKKEAEKRGIKAERLVFSKRMPYSEHIARHRLADMFLDTFYFNAGASASAALLAGVPIVCKMGKGFITRVTASMLSAIGMHELINETVQDYEALILDFATNPKRAASIKRKLEKNRLSTPLFDTELFTKHLEDGYQQAYQRYFEGKGPESIVVESQISQPVKRVMTEFFRGFEGWRRIWLICCCETDPTKGHTAPWKRLTLQI